MVFPPKIICPLLALSNRIDFQLCRRLSEDQDHALAFLEYSNIFSGELHISIMDFSMDFTIFSNSVVFNSFELHVLFFTPGAISPTVQDQKPLTFLSLLSPPGQDQADP